MSYDGWSLVKSFCGPINLFIDTIIQIRPGWMTGPREEKVTYLHKHEQFCLGLGYSLVVQHMSYNLSAATPSTKYCLVLDESTVSSQQLALGFPLRALGAQQVHSPEESAPSTGCG